MKKNAVLVIAGPTASGKSKLAIAAAQTFDGVIINCDSMQIYKGIPVISAAPGPAERQQAEHRLYELYDCSKHGNVVEWLDLCVAEIKSLWKQKRLPIVVGGTGLYIEALVKGVTPIPEIPQDIRQKVQLRLQTEGLEKLYADLQHNDIEITAKIHQNDTTRILRATEIFEYTGQKTSDWYKIPLLQKIPEADFITVKIVPTLDEIAAKCCVRLDDMVYKLGALKEIETLVSRNLPDTLPAMKALGVPELSRFVKGELSLTEALDLAKLHTRQYAKRQRTWLNNRLPADLVFTSSYVGQKDYLSAISTFLH
ncbi:MAG: tRNA (adenosine(37)-N6)-dimethylallyltransferase MiaA [Alphaproteobacteria bacterium]|nr:tRNA (adenosine(37)-N6)-dimethylallyltransferase MiaA [Alphaproteobacteria bacterium]